MAEFPRGPARPVLVVTAQGCDLQHTVYAGENWRATFFVIGMAHSIVKGFAYEPKPCRAVWEPVNGI
jgi:hypothetical protein